MSSIGVSNLGLPNLLTNFLSDPHLVFDSSATAAHPVTDNTTTNVTSDHGSTSDHGGGHGVHGPEVLSAVFVLFIASITKYVHVFWGRKLGIPYSVLVILIGIAMAFGTFSLTDDNAVIGNLFTSAINIKGDVAFLLFLPLLLFLPAYHIPLHSFRVLWKQILITSFLGRALDIFFVAFASTILIDTEGGTQSWDVLLGLVFSSMVTATDSGEIESGLRASGCDKSVAAIMTTTSLIGNFMSFIWHDLITDAMLAYSTKSVTVLHVFTNFLLGFCAAPAFGLVWGMALSYAMSRIYNYWMSEVLIMVSVPYLTSWFAYELFGVSGMTSVIVLGLWMNYKRASISVKVQEFLNQFLETVAFIMDVFVFLLVGYYVATVADSLVASHGTDYTYNWQKELIVYFTMFAFMIWSHFAVLNILRIILKRMRHGAELYDLRNVLLMTWTTPKGAVAMLLLHHTLDAYGDVIHSTRPDSEMPLMVNVVAVIAISQMVQGLTMSRLIRIMAMNAEHAESPVAVITRKGFLDMISDLRHEQVASMKDNQLFHDVDWEMVSKYTSVDTTEMGLKGENKDPVQHMKELHHHLHNGKVLTAQIKCTNCDKASSIPREITELNHMAMSRIIKAKKMAYRRQFEEGMLTTAGMKVLCDLADDVLSHRKGVIGSRDIQHYFYSNLAFYLKNKLSLLDTDRVTVVDCRDAQPAPGCRRKLYHIVQTPQFENILQGVILLNVILTICALVMTSDDPVLVETYSVIFAILNAGFALIYTAETFMKMYGLGLKQYWGKGWMTWNRFDLFILLMTYVDLIMEVVTLTGAMSASLHVFNPAAIRILRLARVLRASRALRLLRPLTPYMLKFNDIFVTAHLYEAYNVCRGYVVGQEEVLAVLNQLVSFVPMALGYRLEAERDAKDVAKEIGQLNMARPDIATAVKTRQAVRAVLNSIEGTILHLKHHGILEEDDYEKIDHELDIAMKKLSNLPNKMPMRDVQKRLRNMPWVSKDEKTFEALRTVYEQRTFDIGSTFLDIGDPAEGIYIIVNGLAVLRTLSTTIDNPKLGEIYNTDNIRAMPTEDDQHTVSAIDYALPGNALNEQALLIGFPRRSYAVAETKVDVIYIPADKLFEAFKLVPELERALWKHIVVTVVVNIELRMHSLSEADYNDEKMRLSGGVIRLALPNRIVTELDSFAEIFLIVGSVMDFSNNAVHQAPIKLPNSIKAVKVKSGRTKSVDENGNVLYPDYAVFFLVPHDGITVEEVKHGPSNMNLSPEEHSPFGAVNQFRASIVGRTRMDNIGKPVKSKVNLLTAGMSKLFHSHSTSSVAPAPEAVSPPASEEDEAVIAYAKSQKSQRQRMSISGAGGVPTMALPEQTVRLRAAGFRRSTVTGPTNPNLLNSLSPSGPSGPSIHFAHAEAPETRHHHHRDSDVNAPIEILADRKSEPLLSSPSSEHLL